MNLTLGDFEYLGICLEGFLYGLYSGIFAMYLQSKRDTGGRPKTKNILLYALCILYVLCLATGSISVAGYVFGTSIRVEYLTNIATDTISVCCDFISQAILIYRCWIVWGYSIRVVIIPSVLAFTFLATWLVSNGSVFYAQGEIFQADWGSSLNLAGLAISMSVNALATGLIVFRIFKVFQEVKVTTLDDQILGGVHGSSLRSIIFILIESGMALFSIQFATLVVNILAIGPSTTTWSGPLKLITCMQPQFNGITPTIILVRVSMGLSCNSEKSLEEVIGSLRFVSQRQDSEERESVGITVDEERREDDSVDVERVNHDIIVDSDR